MSTDHAQDSCVLYLSDVHGEYDTFAYLVSSWRDDVRWTHLVGDVYDRGPAPDRILDFLETQSSFDIEWGNHDIVWMGAALGQAGCICHVVRNCARYGNLDILTDAYGMDLAPLERFARQAYADSPLDAFKLKSDPGLSPDELALTEMIQKATAILQFKVEAALIDAYPEFGLQDRKLLHLIDYDAGTVEVDGVVYELTDVSFPTVDGNDPYRLTPEEEAVMDSLVQAFTGSGKLMRHIRLMFEHGSLYRICDGDLLLHACVPLDDNGTLKEANIYGTVCKGKELYDVAQDWVRKAFESSDPQERERGRDLIWYLWLGPASPLFAKSKMATFELYLIAEKEARKEVKNPFYTLMDDESVIDGIFREFDIDPSKGHIICGHVPVKVKDGEDPVRCGGKVFTIDGGFAKAYQPTTGIAGYTLISNSYGFVLAAHEPLESREAAVAEERDIHSSRRVVEVADHRSLIADTDIGAELKEQIDDLDALLAAYRTGEVVPRD